MDNFELGVCLTTEIGMVMNFIVYGGALAFIMIKHNQTLSCVTKFLLTVPLFEFIIVLCYITPIMLSGKE